MRIVVLTHGASPFGHQYASAFGAQGHQAEVFSLSECDGVADGTRVRIVGPPGFNPWKTDSRWPYVRAVMPVRRALREVRPDILFALYLSSAGLIACLSGHPRLVVSAQGSDVNTRIGSRLWRAVFRWEGRRAGFVHAVSVPLAETLEHVMGIPREKLLVCPIGVDTNLLAYVEPSRRPGAGRILCTRAHGPVYDQPTLVRAMGRLKRGGAAATLVFTSTARVEATRAAVAEAGLEDRIAFRPGYRFEELPALLAEADVYASASRSDGTSQSLLEAMATGLFPVVSDIPANRPWVEHGRNGLLFPVGDDAALAERLKEALGRPDLRAAAAPVNREIVRTRGDLHRLAWTLLEAFGRLLAGRPPAGGP